MWFQSLCLNYFTKIKTKMVYLKDTVPKDHIKLYSQLANMREYFQVCFKNLSYKVNTFSSDYSNVSQCICIERDSELCQEDKTTYSKNNYQGKHILLTGFSMLGNTVTSLEPLYFMSSSGPSFLSTRVLLNLGVCELLEMGFKVIFFF